MIKEKAFLICLIFCKKLTHIYPLLFWVYSVSSTKEKDQTSHSNGTWRKMKTGTRTLYPVIKEIFSKKFVMMRKNIHANSYEKKACATTNVKGNSAMHN